jgi:16S rRNA (guanine(966)-N(2))-methyltransferase RsmD
VRIVAGSHRGRPLLGPKGPGLRPTADRVRESLFNLLGQRFEGGTVLDLYAGTGALAFEALSRGMTRAVLVDSGAESERLVQANARSLGFDSVVTFLRLPVERALVRLGSERRQFELVFADPPYASGAAASLVEAVRAADVLAPGGILCVEHGHREPSPPGGPGLIPVEQRRFGDTAVSLFRADAAGAG